MQSVLSLDAPANSRPGSSSSLGAPVQSAGLAAPPGGFPPHAVRYDPASEEGSCVFPGGPELGGI